MKKTEQHEEDQNGEESPDLFIDNGELYFGKEVKNTCELILEGEMTADEVESWLRRKLAPQLGLSEQRIRDFMLHANDLERLRLGQQLEALRER